MPKVSVIIPVYNTRDYIIACIDSLLKQTLDDLEVILVDDHGEDNSIELVKKHIAGHPRELMFRFSETPQNSGPGIARNVGISMACGEYVAFADSDDWTDPTIYETLYTQAVTYSTDLCCCNAVIHNQKTQSIITNPDISSGAFSIKNKRYFLTHFIASSCLFIYKTAFLSENKIYFPEGRSAEDSFFVTHCLLAAQSIAQVQENLYHYRIHEDSLTQQTNADRYKQKVDTFGKLLDTTDRYTDYRQELEFMYLKKGYIIPMLNYIRNAKQPNSKELKDNYLLLKQRIPTYQQNTYYKNHRMVRVLIGLLHRTPRIAIFTLPLLLRFSRYNTIV